jgi:carbon-monoxide dehydrogenase medium subunit
MINTYINCATIGDAVSALAEYQGRAKIIAGGTDLVLELEKGAYSDRDVLIDVSRITDLDQITLDSQGMIHLGSMVTHNHVVSSSLLHEKAPLLVEACFGVGSPQIRNRGTVTGNLITGSPANDTISPLMALNASLTLVSLRGTRRVALNDFYKGVRKTVIERDEICTEIVFQPLAKNQVSVYKKYALRKAQAISLVNASVILSLEGQKVAAAQITLGAVAPVIIHAKQAESFLIGKPLTEETVKQAAALVAEDVSPISDIRSSADYRVKISCILVKRGLLDLLNQKPIDVPTHPVLLWGTSQPNQTDNNYQKTVIDRQTTIHATVNGKKVEVVTSPNKPLLHMLREELGMTGSKEGCGEGECGACTAYLDGVAVMSCLVPAARAEGTTITTIEGISEGEQLHPVQEAFIREGAVQCGYCTPGFVMSAVKLFEEKKNPDVDEIKLAITGNLCRCTGYYKIVKAIESVSEES